jgi:alkylation response protein AidB-like acyl-CoA dehydrogenase
VCERGGTQHERAAVVARAKSRCSDAGMFAVKHCIQMHGAIAYTEEYALSRYIRRAITLASSHGTAAAHRRRYAALELNLGQG